MTLIAVPQYAAWKPLKFILKIFHSKTDRLTDFASSNKLLLADREFVLEMMQSHPEAFQCEFDFQTMMHCHSFRF